MAILPPAVSAPGAQLMMKILMGLTAVVVIAAGGFFGFELYTQYRVARDVETVFEQIRSGGGKASHGKVSFDLKSRTVRIADIATESATQPPVSVKVASVTAIGVGQPDSGRFSADSVEASDVEISVTLAGAAAGNLTYKVPRLVVKDYAGPASLQQPQASASAIDAYRFALQQFAAISAASIEAPTISGTLKLGPAMSGEFVYSGTTLRDIKAGKIASMQVERVNFSVDSQQAGKADKMTGEILNVASLDFDATAAVAILDPQKANDSQYYRFYGKTTAGPYTVTSALGLRMHVDEMMLDDVGIRPSRLQLPALQAAIQAAGTAPPSPAQTRELMEKAATIYESVRIGTAEVRGLSAETPQGPLKLQTIRFNLEDGKVGEFAVEGLDTRTPKGPVKLGRFALKALDVAGLLRTVTQYSTLGQPPSPDKALALIPLIEGVELKALVAPFKNTGKPVNIETFSLDWGQFVGSIPTRIRLTTKMTTPFDPADASLKPLIAAGLDKAVIDNELGVTWTEATKTFALEPVSLDLGGLLKANAHLSLGNVPRGVFTLNPLQAVTMAEQIEVGALELVLRDMGAVDIALAQYARTLAVTRDAARQSLIDELKTGGERAAATNPDAVAATHALTRFLDSPGQTLIVKLTPRAKVPALQLFQLLQTDPLLALAQFRIEASTGL
jgi:hypothetical protein